MRRMGGLFAAWLLLMAGCAVAEEVVTYHGCVDANGRPVAALEDGTLKTVVGSGTEAGLPVIRYNPAVLPELSPAVRLFFYAQECARHGLGPRVAGRHDLEAARRADCGGLAALVRSGLVEGAAGVAALQAEMRFSGAQWRLLPGPARSFDLPACYEAERARPTLYLPSSAQPDWNACVRQCAEGLRVCTGAGGAQAPACRQRYERCSSVCEFRFPS